MSNTIYYRHTYEKSFLDSTNKKNKLQEIIIDGEKGLSFSLMKLEGPKYVKINVKEISKDKFSLKKRVDQENTSQDLTLPELKKMITSDKSLLFIKKYIDEERSIVSKNKKTLSGGRKISKKTSKKLSKKLSKKTSKKPSKKISKKTSKKTSRKK